MRLLKAIPCFAALSAALLAQPTANTPRFDLADVHPSPNATNPYTFVSGGVLRDARYDLRKVTMLDLIRIAYGVDPGFVWGGPNWLEFDRFDIAAKAPPRTSSEDIRLMLQSLLADRFHLVLHKDTKLMPAFTLALPAAGEKHKLSEARGAGNGSCEYQQQPPESLEIVYFCRNVTMDAFAKQLQGFARDYVTNPVVNATGLQGAWNFDLRWNSRSKVLPATAQRTTIFDAVAKQLGLSLELKDAPAPVLVIDSVNEKPTANAAGVSEALPPRPVEFEVATLKRATDDAPRGFSMHPSGLFEAKAIDMKTLMALAWDIDMDHIDKALVNAPKWMDSTRLTITGKPPTFSDGFSEGAPPSGAGFVDDETRLMVRALMIDRFQMKTHLEDRPGYAYSLVADKPKLKKADPSNRANCKEARAMAKDPRDANPVLSRLISCQNVSMAQFAHILQRLSPGDFPNEVLDATGLPGTWDFTLNFTPTYLLRRNDAATNAESFGASDPNGGISLFDAMKRQLGLKLELQKRNIPKLVIDHIEEKPSEN